MDADALVRAINERYGHGLTLVGQAQHGETSGAVYVRWPGGREGVITGTDVPLWRMRQTAEVMESLRAKGLPVPRQEPIQLDDGSWPVRVLPERLPGSPPDRADAAVIEAEGVAKFSNDGFVLESEGPWRSTMVSADSRLILTIDRRGARNAVRESRGG